MKKTTLALAVAIASLSTAAFAAQPDNSFYVGGKTGWSAYHDASLYNGASDDMHISKDRVGAGAFLGYQANPYLAIEIGYDWLGHADYRSKATGDKAKLTVQGASVTGKLSYPLSFISDDLDIYVRGGAFIHRTEWKEPSVKERDTSVSPVAAIGFDYQISEHFSTRLDYQWINNIGNASGQVRPDNSFLAFGVSYNFGSMNKEKAVELEYVENRYVLSEDILFGYNQSALKPAGTEALDGLIKALVTINPTESAIVVIGHTDRIGSNAYNQKLSVERAKSVMDYLVSKGVPADLISAKGVGKSDPVTGTACNTLTGADLKACLAPDRRVEIEIKALNVEEVIIEQK